MTQLPDRTTEIYETKCERTYRRVYDHCVGPGESVYEVAVGV
jgi:hypothetical protein